MEIRIWGSYECSGKEDWTRIDEKIGRRITLKEKEGKRQTTNQNKRILAWRLKNRNKNK